MTKRHRWAAFIRELAGRVAQQVRKETSHEGKFWLYRPYTSIVEAGEGLREREAYLHLNDLEAEGTSRARVPHPQDLRAFYAMVNGTG